MAVAVKNSPESTTQNGASSLFASSALGAVYVLGALAIVTIGVPYLWSSGISTWVREHLGRFVDAAGLIVVELFAIGVLAVFGLSLAGGRPAAGLKGGVFAIVAVLFLAALLASSFAKAWPGVVGDSIGLVVALVILFFAYRWAVGPSYSGTMRAFEGQGWFSTGSYKPNQGKKVRRATLLGILVLIGAGIWSLLHSTALDSMSKDWILKLPFLSDGIKILPDVRMTLPILLIALGGWFSYRIVNMPTFAEFLIATEGELNKIAWPTRRSLIQDTIVVLTTVVFMTVFLFVVDIAWGKILSSPYVNVLRLEPANAAQKAAETQELDW